MIQSKGKKSTSNSDSVSLEITRNGLAAIADEMAISHVRAAYSSVARDMLDFSTAVCDAEGRVVAQGLSLAIQLGAIPRLMKMMLERVGTPGRGDVYFVNHPWQGGVHIPDVFFVKPVYLDDDTGTKSAKGTKATTGTKGVQGEKAAKGAGGPAAYTVLVSHMVDMGGRYPGSISPSAASLWEEGLVIPLLPLVKAGVTNQPLLDLIAANTREPAAVLGDIRSALGALEAGAAQYRDFARRMGADTLSRQIEHFLNTTERAARAAFRRDIPDGTASAEDYLDSAAPGCSPPKIACTVIKKGDRIRFDFTGTDPQVAGGFNCTIADVMSVAAFAARSVLTEDVPVNDGFYRCLEFDVPEGSLINAQYPAGVCARGSTVCRLNDVAMAAMANLVPGQLPAAPGGRAAIFFSGNVAGKAWVFLDYIGPGWGGRPNGDGVPGLSHPLVNAANIPVEVIEQQFPLRVTEYSLTPGVHGAGLHASAPSTLREYESLQDGMVVNQEMLRDIYVAPGVVDGEPGSRAVSEVRRAGSDSWESVAPIGHVKLNRGDRLRCQLASGGGYGRPAAESRDKAGAHRATSGA